MSKKHFRELARRFWQLKPAEMGTKERGVWWGMVQAVADVCQSANERFDRGRFIEACENGL